MNDDEAMMMVMGNGKRALILEVDCNGPYRPGEMVTCIVRNKSKFGGRFTYTLRHLGPGRVDVPISSCKPDPAGGPHQIAARGEFVITCNSKPGLDPDTPDNWQMIARTVDPTAVVVHGGIILGHSEESTADYGFDGNSKPMEVFLGRVAGSYFHKSGFSE